MIKYLKGHWSLGSLFVCQVVKSLWVTAWLNRWVSVEVFLCIELFWTDKNLHNVWSKTTFSLSIPLPTSDISMCSKSLLDLFNISKIKNSQKTSLFRHASVSRTYPCKLVRWSVGPLVGQSHFRIFNLWSPLPIHSTPLPTRSTQLPTRSTPIPTPSTSYPLHSTS